MEFIIYKKISVSDLEELEKVNITSMEELENLYKEYGQEDEPIQVYFYSDHRCIIIENHFE